MRFPDIDPVRELTREEIVKRAGEAGREAARRGTAVEDYLRAIREKENPVSQTPERPPITKPSQSFPEQIRELGGVPTTTNTAPAQPQPVPPQSALTKWILEPQPPDNIAALLEMIATHERLAGPDHDGRGTVELVLREVGYALPKIERNAPLWQWVQRMQMVRWGYFPVWLARPVIGNLFLLSDGVSEEPSYVGVVKKYYGLDRRGIYRLGANDADEGALIPISRINGYLVPPDGCLTCVQRAGLLRRE